MLNLFKKKKPNVIMIMLDGVRYDALDKIPYFNALKKESVFFPHLITYAPYTIGSLHSTFSGMYGNRNGVNGYYRSYNFDKEHCFTLPQYFRENGYHTETDLINANVIPNQGFEKVRVHDEFKDDLIKRHSEILHQIKSRQPFFLFLDYSNVHTNLVTNVIKKYSEFDENYFKNRPKNFQDYLRWVEESSRYLESVLGKIKELGIWDNSIVLVFTDHGASTGDRIGEKAYGVYLYEYTVRSFLYMIGKDFPKNREIKHLVRSIDILPTLLDLFKLKEKSGYKPVQGTSFLPFIRGNPEERIAYCETGGLDGPTPSPEIHNIKGIRTNVWKFIYNEANKKKELYNLENDREEKNNLIGKESDVERRMWEALQKQEKENSAL